MTTIHDMRPQRLRTIWISDVHLGFKGCRADYLLDFLHATECETLYLVGDIIDLWQMRSGIYWPQEHNNVIRTILGKAKRGTRVVYVPGNHDDMLREYDGMSFGNVAIRREAIHTTADGRRLLVLHGDEFDSVIKCSKLLAILGSHAYDWLLRVNRLVNWWRTKRGRPYWSLAAYLKHKVKNAVNYISNFEHAVAAAAKRHRVDGLVCGHIHRAEITEIDGITYINDGDWVESCTALVERYDGSLHLLQWTTERQHTLKSAWMPKEDDGAVAGRAA